MTVRMRTHYDVLGVARDADDAEIKRAWKVLVREWHPDRFDAGERADAQARTQEINEAWATLRNEQQRSRYDARLRLTEERAAARVTPGVSSRRTSSPTVGPQRAPHRSGSTSGAANPALDFLREIVAAANRHPRVAATAAGLWIFIIAAVALTSVLSGPSLPLADQQAAWTPPAAQVAAPQSGGFDGAATDLEGAPQMEQPHPEGEPQPLPDDAGNSMPEEQHIPGVPSEEDPAFDPSMDPGFDPGMAQPADPGAAVPPPPRRIMRVMPAQPRR